MSNKRIWTYVLLAMVTVKLILLFAMVNNVSSAEISSDPFYVEAEEVQQTIQVDGGTVYITDSGAILHCEHWNSFELKNIIWGDHSGSMLCQPEDTGEKHDPSRR